MSVGYKFARLKNKHKETGTRNIVLEEAKPGLQYSAINGDPNNRLAFLKHESSGRFA